MYNRYIPGSNGVYERQTVQEPTPTIPVGPLPLPTPELDAEGQQSQICQTKVFGIDLGDLLLLCIILLLLVESDGEDQFPLILLAAGFLMQQ